MTEPPALLANPPPFLPCSAVSIPSVRSFPLFPPVFLPLQRRSPQPTLTNFPPSTNSHRSLPPFLLSPTNWPCYFFLPPTFFLACSFPLAFHSFPQSTLCPCPPPLIASSCCVTRDWGGGLSLFHPPPALPEETKTRVKGQRKGEWTTCSLEGIF